MLTAVANAARKLIPARLRPTGYLESLVCVRTGGRTRCGPFMGMRCAAPTLDSRSAHIPKLLGTYECELASCIEKACSLQFSLIVNVGAAEGYYAVGMALRNPSARVIAFEMQQREREALAENVKLNNVAHRVEINGKCEPAHLEKILADTPRPFLICDAESDESILLDPAIVPTLQRTFILVELHEFIQRGISKKIRERFAATHRTSQIWQQERTIAEFPFQTFYIRCLPKRYLRWAVSESRPERMSWFWMEPMSAVSGQ